MVDLSTNVGGLGLKNPVMIASGFVYRPETVVSIAMGVDGTGKYGPGAVVPKTFRRYPEDGHEPPIFDTLPGGGGINAIGLSCPGVDELAERYKPFADMIRGTGAKLVISVKPEKMDDFVYVVRCVLAFADGFEVNGSCPNVEGGRALCLQPELTGEYVDAVKQEAPEKPLFFKVSPDCDVVAPAQAAKEAGATGVVGVNTSMGKFIDRDTGWPLISYGTGGISGPPLLPKGLKCVSELYQADLGIDIIGCGGISGFDDMVRYFREGARAVQWGTELFADSPIELEYCGNRSVRRKIKGALEGLREYLESYGSFGGFLEVCRNG